MCSHFDCSLGCGSILNPLLVRNVSTGAGNNDLASPDLLRGDEDGPVGNRFIVPVAGNKIHVFANQDTAIVHGKRGASASELLFHSDVSGVRKRLVVGNARREFHDLLMGARGVKVVSFSESSQLFPCERHECERDKGTYGMPCGTSADERHRDRIGVRMGRFPSRGIESAVYNTRRTQERRRLEGDVHDKTDFYIKSLVRRECREVVGQPTSPDRPARRVSGNKFFWPFDLPSGPRLLSPLEGYKAKCLPRPMQEQS